MKTTNFFKNIISTLAFWLTFNILYTFGDINSNGSIRFADFSENFSDQHKQPCFENEQNVNLTAVENDSVILKCAVRYKGNKTVSWLRKEDVHILTSEDFVFSGDTRFMVQHPKDSIEWNLKIDQVTLKDSGFYECQVNTDPKITQSVYLEVIVPEILQERAIVSANSLNGKVKFAKITGSSHVKVGSTISLTCIVNHQVPSIQWFHNDHAIEFNSNRGGINLETEKNSDSIISRLLLTRAQLRDNGNYSCLPLGALPASAIVHVLDEQPAAKYMSNGTKLSLSIMVEISYLIFLIFVLSNSNVS